MPRYAQEDPEDFARRMDLQAALLRKLLPLLPSPPDAEDLDDGFPAPALLFHAQIKSPPEARWMGSGGKEMKRSFQAGTLGRLSVIISWNSRFIHIEWDVSIAPTRTSMLIQLRDPKSGVPLSELFNTGALARRRWSISSKNLGFSPRKQWALNLTIVKNR
jgi:hypothetical protein